MPSVLGAQMYTLREHLKTPADIAQTCRRVRQLGYENVQISGLGPIDVQELAKILAGEGLACVATHVAQDLLRDVNRCLDYHRALKCRYPAIGGAWLAQPITAPSYRQFAQDYSALAQPLAAQGLTIGYHNHSHELIQFDGQAALDILIQHCARPHVWFEIDTYWITHGGGDPAAWIQKVAGRIPCVHLKDMSMGYDAGGKVLQKMAEVGAGNLNWPRILDACKQAGVEYYLVERDQGDLDPFDSLKASLDNLHALGLS